MLLSAPALGLRPPHPRRRGCAAGATSQVAVCKVAPLAPSPRCLLLGRRASGIAGGEGETQGRGGHVMHAQRAMSPSLRGGEGEELVRWAVLAPYAVSWAALLQHTVARLAVGAGAGGVNVAGQLVCVALLVLLPGFAKMSRRAVVGVQAGGSGHPPAEGGARAAYVALTAVMAVGEILAAPAIVSGAATPMAGAALPMVSHLVYLVFVRERVELNGKLVPITPRFMKYVSGSTVVLLGCLAGGGMCGGWAAALWVLPFLLFSLKHCQMNFWRKGGY